MVGDTRVGDRTVGVSVFSDYSFISALRCDLNAILMSAEVTLVGYLPVWLSVCNRLALLLFGNFAFFHHDYPEFMSSGTL